MGTSMAGFLLPSLVLLLTATELRWVVALINTKLIFYPHLGFQGICSWARDLEFWQPDRGVQLCGGGEKCFQGVKTGHKVCRKCLIKLSCQFPQSGVSNRICFKTVLCVNWVSSTLWSNIEHEMNDLNQGTLCVALFVGKSSLLLTAKRQSNSRFKS